MKATRDAIASKDGSAALLAALAWWREARSPAIADLIDAISARVSGPPIEDEREWTIAATNKDPVDLGRLLPAITSRSLNVSFLPRAADMLSGFPDDPRLSIAVATWSIDPVTTSSSTYPFWTKMLEKTGSIGDLRAIALMKKRLAKPQEKSQFWPKFYKALEKVCAKLKTIDAPPAVDEAALKKMVAGVARLSVAVASPTSSSPTRARARARARIDDVPNVDGTLLEQATKHLAANRLVPAIDAMVERWRETRVPSIADAIERVTRLLPTWGKPLGDSVKSVDEAWMAAIASDPSGTMPQLLENINVGGSSIAERHVMALENLPDDPRINLRLAELAWHNGMSPERTQYWKSLFQILASGKDVRICAPLREKFRDFTGTYYNHHRQGKRIIGAFVLADPTPLALHASDEKALKRAIAEIEKLEAKKDRTEFALLAAIGKTNSNTKDTAPRLVYADWLSERGRALGELIVLECKAAATTASLTPGETKRKKELEKVPYLYGRALTDLADWGHTSKTDRGLVFQFTEEWSSGPMTWRASMGDPALSIVETIHINDNERAVASFDDVARLLLHDDCARLTQIVCNTKGNADALEPLVKSRFTREKKTFVRMV